MGETVIISNITIADAVKDSLVGDIFMEDGKIIEVAASITREADVRIDATGKSWTVAPGFIDIHIHGSASFDVMDATPEVGRDTSIGKRAVSAWIGDRFYTTWTI